jgi:hypothetical protein
MPSSLARTTVEQTLCDAAARATLAPSVHNTQPWRFVVHPDRLDVYADRSRRVPVVDPTGRQLILSCGAAIFGARMALAAARLDAVTTVLPDRGDASLLASVRVLGPTPCPDDVALRLDTAADLRHSNRRHFAADPVSDAELDRLVAAAKVEGAWLHLLRDLDDRAALATLCQRADSLQRADPAYLEELRAWTSDDPERTDGVPAVADTPASLNQTMVVLCTAGDMVADWLSAGQALGRVLLELTSAGLVAGIMSQAVEEPATRDILRRELRLAGHPQLLIRIGVADRTRATPRRPIADVITIDAG